MTPAGLLTLEIFRRSRGAGFSRGFKSLLQRRALLLSSGSHSSRCAVTWPNQGKTPQNTIVNSPLQKRAGIAHHQLGESAPK